MRKSIVPVLAALFAAAFLAPAAAADEVTVVVSSADLDLSAPAGNAALAERIDAAVKQVCARPDMRDLKAMMAWEKCKTSAHLGAMEQLSILEPYESMALAGRF